MGKQATSRPKPRSFWDLVRLRSNQSRTTPSTRRRRSVFDALESREMLSGAGTDYVLEGGQWNNSVPITFSFAPDGVAWDKGTNTVNSQLDAEFGGTGWQTLVAKALQTWAASANLNFVEVPDGAYSFNTTGSAQGDPRFGDIRVAGYSFGVSSTIANTYGPPPDGSTAAGDVVLDTAYNFSPTSRYDFQTVILHELGHSLGLAESPQPTSVMYTYFSGVRQSLSSYDVEGIQAIYGPRTPDSLQSTGQATSASTAADLTSYLNSSGEAEYGNVSLATIGDVEYFSVVAPQTTGATLRVAAQAGGHSLLSPKISLIDPSTGAVLATDAHADQFGDLASVSIPNAVAGHRYLIAVTGATQDVFAVGSYAVQVGFSGGTPINPPVTQPVVTQPVVTQPVVTQPAAPQTLTIAPDRYANNNTFASAAELGYITQTTVVGNLTIPQASSVHVFAFETPYTGIVYLASANTVMLVGDAIARPVVSGTGLIAFVAPVAGARYFLVILSPNGQPVPSFGFAIQDVSIPTSTVRAASVSTTPVTTTAKVTQVSKAVPKVAAFRAPAVATRGTGRTVLVRPAQSK